METIKKLDGVGQELRSKVKGRDDVIDSLILAIASGEHIMIQGSHGEAKSMVVRLLCEVSGLNYFYRQIHNETTVKDIVGILNPLSYKKGEIELIKTSFWSANIHFYDEFLRGRSEFLDFLMEVMQERKCSKTLEGEKELPVLSVIATTNPLTEEYNTERLDLALKDRFAIILNIEHLIGDNPEAVQEVLQRENNSKIKKIDLSVEELRAIRERSTEMEYDVDVVMTLFSRLRDKGFVFSTRFIELYRDMSRVQAVLQGHKFVESEDYFNVGVFMLNNRFEGLDYIKVRNVLDECIMSGEHKDVMKKINNALALAEEESELLIQDSIEIIADYGEDYLTFPEPLKVEYDKLMEKVDVGVSSCLKELSPEIIKKLDTERFKHHVKEYIEFRTRKTKYLKEPEYAKAKKLAEKTCKHCQIEEEELHDRRRIIITPELERIESFREVKKFEEMCAGRGIRIDIDI